MRRNFTRSTKVLCSVFPWILLSFAICFLAHPCHAVRVGPVGLRRPPARPPSYNRKITPDEVPLATVPATLVSEPPVVNISPVGEAELRSAKEGEWWDDEYVRSREAGSAASLRSAPAPAAAAALISVQLPDDSTIQIQGGPGDTPHVLLDRVQASRPEIAAQDHQLLYGGKVLTLLSPLSAQNVPSDAKLHVKPAPAVIAHLPEGSLFSAGSSASPKSATPSSALSEQLAQAVAPADHVEPAETAPPAGSQQVEPVGSQQVESAGGSEEVESEAEPAAGSEGVESVAGPPASQERLAAVPEQRVTHQQIPAAAPVEAAALPTYFVLETQTQEKLPFAVPASTAVTELKEQIAARTGLAPVAQQLKYNDVLVADGNTLQQAGVPVGATLTLDRLAGVYARVLGGAAVPLALEPTALGSAVRKAAAEKAGVKPEDLECWFNGEALKLTRALAESGAAWGVTVDCKAAPSLVVKDKASGETYPLHVQLSSPVSVAKRQLEDPTGLTEELQVLSYNGNVLSNAKSFSDEGVPDGAQVELERSPDAFVKLLDGTVEPLTLNGLQTTVADLLATAAQMSGKSPAEVFLAYKGKQLAAEGTLASEDVPLGQTLVLVSVAPMTRSLSYDTVTGLRVQANGEVIELPHLTTDDVPESVLAAINRGGDGSKLFYDDKSLESGTPLNAQGVPDNATLDCRSASFVRRIYRVMVIYLAILFLLGMAAQWLIRLLTFKVAKTQDIFVRQFMESVFRAISIIAIVIMVVEVVLNVDVFEFGLEARIFGDFEGEEASNHLRLTFRKMMEKTQFFLAVYLGMVLSLALLVWRTDTWLSRLDRTPTLDLLNKGEASAEMTFATLRTDFALSVGVMAIRGVDPEFYNFYEYLRSCILVAAEQFIRLPNTCLLIGFLSCSLLLQFHSVTDVTRMWWTLAVTALPTLMLLALWFRCRLVKTHLQANDPQNYLEEAAPALQDPDRAEELRDLPSGPRYLLGEFHRETHAPNFIVRWVYRTRYPNRHESLFWLWRSGPAVLCRLFELAFFVALLCGGEGIYAINRNWPLWARKFGRWPMLGFWLLLLVPLSFLPWLVWDLIVVTRCGGMVDQQILKQVWRLQRSETIRRVARLVDLLRIEASLWEIESAGPGFMEQLRQRSVNVSPAVARQNQRMWEELDDDEDGQINLPQLFNFLNRKGLNVESENEAANWFRVFDADNSGGIELEEFCCVVSIAKQLTGQPMDVPSVTTLLTSKFGLDPTDNRVITTDTLTTKLLKPMGLLREWNANHVLHLLDMIEQGRGGGETRNRAMSVSEFVQGLKKLEKETLGTLTGAIDELALKKTREPSVV